MIKIEVKIKEGNDGVIISRKVMALDGTEAEDMFASSIAGLVDEVMDNVEAEIEEGGACVVRCEVFAGYLAQNGENFANQPSKALSSGSMSSPP